MVKTIITEHPDITLNSNNSFHDTLDIWVHRDWVEFVVGIDGTGNTFKIKKEMMRKLVK